MHRTFWKEGKMGVRSSGHNFNCKQRPLCVCLWDTLYAERNRMVEIVRDMSEEEGYVCMWSPLQSKWTFYTLGFSVVFGTRINSIWNDVRIEYVSRSCIFYKERKLNQATELELLKLQKLFIHFFVC